MGEVLSDAEVERFVGDGFVRVERAFDGELAARCVDALWPALHLDRDDPLSWTEPVVRIPGSGHPDLLAALKRPPYPQYYSDDQPSGSTARPRPKPSAHH